VKVTEQLEASNNLSAALPPGLGSDSALARQHSPASTSNSSSYPAPESTSLGQSAIEPPVQRLRPTLLVVDDEAEVLRSVHDLLRLDYRVVTFQRGAHALDFLRSEPNVEVILTDHRMPEMQGVEVLRQAMAIKPETTRLLFTAYSDVHTVIDAINQGHVFRFLSKPCDPELLVAVVRQAVEHHDLLVEKNQLLVDLRETNGRLLEADRLKGAFI
jgi:response regulator RpfG family c-di-GMP phosphodiesterase